jgi:Na+/H+ antiporter NhaD/arsenite permease-like protein
VSDESPKQRIDRELIELLNELRVALPGVQVLFAFLLGIPFANRFREVTGTTEAMYVVALLATAVASALLIAPSAVHRLRFRDERKEEILQLSHRLAIAGMAVLALSIASSVYVVLAFLQGPWTGGPIAAAVALLLAGIWFVLPIVSRLR